MNQKLINRRAIIKGGAAIVTAAMLPSWVWAQSKDGRLRTAHIGLGGMGKADLESIASHESVDVMALCDVDAKMLAPLKKAYPKAKLYSDYRIMLKEMADDIDAVVVSTPDHSHAPASMLAMDHGKAVYCQKTSYTSCF